MNQSVKLHERQRPDVGARVSEAWGPRWHCHTKAELFRPGEPQPYLVKEIEGNQLLAGGASLLWECLIGNGTTASTARKYFNATAALGVSTSLTAASSFQTNLLGTNKKYKALSAAYPTHTTGSTASTAAKVVFKSTFTTTEGNFAWNEWGVFNTATTGANQRMLNRKVGALITKTTAATASLTVTLSLA